MTNKDYLSQFSAIDESIKLSDDKLEQIEGGKCDTTCKKCTTQKNGGHDILSGNDIEAKLLEAQVEIKRFEP